MALLINVTKKSVSKSQPKMWNIVINLKISSTGVWGSKAVVDKDFFIKYRLNEDIDAKQQEILEQIQTAINSYKAEQQILEHEKMDNLVTYLNTNLTV